MNMSQPITPDEAHAKYLSADRFPPEVFDAFNELIEKNWTAGGVATFTQEAVVTLILGKLLIRANATREKIYVNKWLDVEDAYRQKGWDVNYDKPGYNESYAPTFTFKRRS